MYLELFVVSTNIGIGYKSLVFNETSLNYGCAYLLFNHNYWLWIVLEFVGIMNKNVYILKHYHYKDSRILLFRRL